ncbi:MAG: AMP-binding enzyme [Acidimicrobiales bacterium]
MDHGDADFDTIIHDAVDHEPTRLLPNAPLMHCAAQWLALHQLLAGDTVVLNEVNDHLDPREICTSIERHRVNAMLLVGEAFARPFLAELDHGDYDMSSLMLIATGGAVMSPETKARLIERLPAVLILDAAGSSESGSPMRQITAGPGTPDAGVFDVNPSVAVLDAALTRRLEPGDEEIGWFANSGAIPLGYLGDEAKTAKTFPVVAGVRWTVPGDRARLRADGRLELLGRDSVTINSGVEKIFVEEVEAAAIAHPSVADAVVVGRPSQRFGQAVVAVIALRAGVDVSDDDLREAMGKRLARYKLPKTVIRVPEIVRSPAGKADYRWARQLAVDAADPADLPTGRTG